MERLKTQRIWCDPDKIYHVQERYVPVYPGEGDGWIDIFITENFQEAVGYKYGAREQ